MKKFLPFSKRQPSLDRYSVHRGGFGNNEKLSVKSFRRTSATSLNIKSIQVVRGAYNIDLNKVDSSFTKLHKACLLNDEAQVRKQIQKVDNNSFDSSKRYPIHLAIVNGNFTIIKLLVDNGADPNVQDNEGNTPLIKSIESGHEHLVKYLLANGADPNLADLDGNAALHWAIMTESIIAIDALLCSKKCDLLARNGRDETCLHLAVRSPLINNLTYESLIKAGSDLGARDQLGLTAINIAQACNNEVAMTAFNRFAGDTDRQNNKDNLEIANILTCDNNSNQEPVNIAQLCEDYRNKYMSKSKENLEFEKKCIQLTAQIERLRLDMGYMKEHNDTIERDLERLSTENTHLKSENASLREKLKDTKGRHQKKNINDNAPIRHSGKSLDLDNELKINDCQGHEEFQKIKTSLQARIDKLKSGLTT